MKNTINVGDKVRYPDGKFVTVTKENLGSILQDIEKGLNKK